MRTALYVVIGLVLAAAIATYARYESFDPCDWLEHDVVRSSGAPRLVVAAQVRSQFLLDGITDPSYGQCLSAWWKFRADEGAGRK